MEDPIHDIPSVIHTLTQAPPKGQQTCIATYFTPTASFTHPFCRTGSFGPEYLPRLSTPLSSRYFVLQIYRWYKILSPHIDLTVTSVAFDEANLLLYVSIHQIFRIQWIPFHRSDVKLTTVLTLVEDETRGIEIDGWNERQAKKLIKNDYAGLVAPKKRYLIQSQNDLYQTNEFVKFVIPFGGSAAIMLWQYLATVLCVFGAFIMWPVTYLEEMAAERQERIEQEAKSRHMQIHEVEEEHAVHPGEIAGVVVQKVKDFVGSVGHDIQKKSREA